MADQPFKAKRVQTGDSIDYIPSGAKAAGSVIIRGGIIGILELNLAANEGGALDVNGVFDIVKDSSVFVDGDAVYWAPAGSPVGGTASSGAATKTGSAYYLGRAIVDEQSTGLTGDTTVRVLLAQAHGFGSSSPTTPLVDPGASGALPVTASGYIPLVTATAETRTLAAPTFIGQELVIYMKTDGGDCVVTCATTINETGNNTITFDNTGESLKLTAVEEGSNLRWRLAQADGAAMTTV